MVLEEGAGRKVIFSTFDPDCAALLSLKQPRFPVFFLTCGGTKLFQASWCACFWIETCSCLWLVVDCQSLDSFRKVVLTRRG